MNRQAPLRKAIREADEERIQTAIELGLSFEASWSQINQAKKEVKGIPFAYMKQGIKLSEIMRRSYAIQLRLPEDTTDQVIYSKMIRQADQSVMH